MGGTSCAGVTVTYTTCGTGQTTCKVAETMFYKYGEDEASASTKWLNTNEKDGDTPGIFSDITLDSTHAALNRSWQCDWVKGVTAEPLDDTDNGQYTKSAVLTCARFLPLETTELNTSKDARFDGGPTEKGNTFSGSVLLVDPVDSSAAATGRTISTGISASLATSLKGAFQAATVAG